MLSCGNDLTVGEFFRATKSTKIPRLLIFVRVCLQSLVLDWDFQPLCGDTNPSNKFYLQQVIFEELCTISGKQSPNKTTGLSELSQDSKIAHLRKGVFAIINT